MVQQQVERDTFVIIKKMVIKTFVTSSYQNNLNMKNSQNITHKLKLLVPFRIFGVKNFNIFDYRAAVDNSYDIFVGRGITLSSDLTSSQDGHRSLIRPRTSRMVDTVHESAVTYKIKILHERKHRIESKAMIYVQIRHTVSIFSKYVPNAVKELQSS